MADRTFHLYDATVSIAAQGPERRDIYHAHQVDWETFNRAKHALEVVGFRFERDPGTAARYPSISKWHWLGQKSTPGGMLFVSADTYPVGCKFAFFQEIVTVNGNGGRYDFDKRNKMPYLIGKGFEVALRALRAHLTSRGFTETFKVDSPNPDPLAYFNGTWDGEYERRRGTHRFERDHTGWPCERVLALACWGVTAERPLIPQGAVRYFRDHGGHLMRGRCYGGINGMWIVVYGPGRRDYTSRHCSDLFECDPRSQPRRLFPRPLQRIDQLLAEAIRTEDFERAAKLRDVRNRLAPARKAA